MMSTKPATPELPPIFEWCTPRPDIVEGAFNPELFTASLGQVVDSYAGRNVASTPYTDANVFFGEATYPTDGMRALFTAVLRRVTGDPTSGAMIRLETGFGGGKTHSLIGLVHLVKRGTDIKDVVEPLFPDLPLPQPDAVDIVAIAGDLLQVNKPSGTELIPHTLWGELAMQLGGEDLYKELEGDVVSLATPGEYFFDRVFAGRRVVILIDELAQYLARVEVAHPGKGASMVAAFLMSLSTYADKFPRISVVVSLAGARNAFALQSEDLANELSRLGESPVTPEEAVQRAGAAIGETGDVVSRRALSITPIPQNELERVLVCRLFTHIDDDAAEAAAKAYISLYELCSSDLPSEAKRAEYENRIKACYPFHPSVLRFLNEKLASIETFQATRGVLRVTALAIRLIWRKRPYTPLIHIGHLDFSDGQMADEIIGSRLKAEDLRIALNTDVGGPESDRLESSRSHAQSRDIVNPLPSGLPYHEMTWRTVLVNSLVGRAEGLPSELFGINKADAVLSVMMPRLPDTAVVTALEGIKNHAYYLREDGGRYFAHTAPTVNRALNNIREGVTRDAALQLILQASRKVITNQNGLFQVRQDVAEPGDIEDSPARPSIGIIRMEPSRIVVDDFIQTVGNGTPRISQNHVALLIPNTVEASLEGEGMYASNRKAQSLDGLVELARDVLAMDKLAENPGAYGIAPRELDDEFEGRRSRAPNDLQVAVTNSYTRLAYPRAEGAALREIRVVSGEGGTPVVEQIKEILRNDGKIIEEDRAATLEVLRSLKNLFFSLGGDAPSVESIRNAFARQRRWPILEASGILGQVISAGVEKGIWCLFRFSDSTAERPDEIHDAQNQVPLTADLSDAGWSLISVEKARARGWITGQKPSEEKILAWAVEVARRDPETRVSDITEKVRNKSDVLTDADVMNVIPKLMEQERYMVHGGEQGQERKPDDLQEGVEATMRSLRGDDCLVSRAEASKRGWLETESESIYIKERGGEQKLLLSLVKRMGKIAAKGAKSKVEDLRIQSLKVPGGASIDLKISDATPECMRMVDELLEIVMTVGRIDEDTFASIEIEHPEEDCALVAELRKVTE